MKGDQRVLDYLDQQLTLELTAINQYFLHARIFDSWGFHKLGRHEYQESIEEMKHADRLIQRMLFLEGLPKMQPTKLAIGHTIPDALKNDLNLENSGRPALQEAIAYCESVKDYVSREIFEDLLTDTEEHIDYLETQIELVAKLGLQNYLQSQTEEPSS
jgi:bacterioferritin